MRVLVVDTYYGDFLAEHYGQRPGLEDEPYDDQLASLIDRVFGTSDFYSHHLRALGHEARDLIVNCGPLQRRWAAEHGTLGLKALAAGRSLPGGVGPRADAALTHRVAWAQIEEFAPDVLYLQDLSFLSREELERARAAGIRVVGQIASSPPAEELLGGYDLILTSFPHYVERFRALGVGSEYLKIAFEERVLARLRQRGVEAGDESARVHDVAFVGGVDPAVHPQRVELLERVAEVAELEVWGYGAEALPPDSAILRRYRGQAWGLEMYETLARSRIVVNRHIGAAEGHANNMRLYETTGVGTMLLTDAGSNLADLFEPGREVVSYESADDLTEKVRHYMANPSERQAVAAAGQARTLADHTYERRIGELAAILEGAAET